MYSNASAAKALDFLDLTLTFVELMTARLRSLLGPFSNIQCLPFLEIPDTH